MPHILGIFFYKDDDGYRRPAKRGQVDRKRLTGIEGSLFVDLYIINNILIMEIENDL